MLLDPVLQVNSSFLRIDLGSMELDLRVYLLGQLGQLNRAMQALQALPS